MVEMGGGYLKSEVKKCWVYLFGEREVEKCVDEPVLEIP